MDIFDETDKQLKNEFKNNEKLLGTAQRPIRTNAELEEAINTKEFTALYIDKSLFKRLGNQDLKKLNKKHLSFVMVESQPSFKERLQVDVGKLNRITGIEKYHEQIASNVYWAILNTEPRNKEEKILQQKLLEKVNKFIHANNLSLDDKER